MLWAQVQSFTVDGRPDGQMAGLVRENNATIGPNSSAEAEVDWVELVSLAKFGKNKILIYV